MDLVPGRACGGCTVCCTELHINTPGLKKLAGVRCPNLQDDRLCAIYETRPGTCGDFECGWRVMAALGDHWRPDRAGIVLIPKTRENPPGYRANSGVQIMLLRRDALHNAELPGLVAQWVEARVPLFLTVAAPVGFHRAVGVPQRDRRRGRARTRPRGAYGGARGHGQGAVASQARTGRVRRRHLTSRGRVKALQRARNGASIRV